MTLAEWKQECDITEAELQEAAELVGIVRTENSEEQADTLAMAVILKRLEFQPVRICQCCAEPRKIFEHLKEEIREGRQDADRKALLQTILDMNGEFDMSEKDSVELLLSEIHMLRLMDQNGGAGFGTVSVLPMIITAGIAVAAAFLLRPVLVDLIRTVLDRVF